MNCVRCKSTMRKVPRDNVLVDRCPECGGIWLDAGELEMLESGVGHDRAVLLHQARKEIMLEAKRLVSVVGMCPKCERDRLQVVKRRGVELDVCDDCGGIFFDEHELEQMLEHKSESFFSSLLALVRT
ncbi:MAG TPA: zf-TFIIB domain-containing protein [Kiritimatiellia bacterium]|nr:zf-TFIIB domain-containing protein [Kiritimatiellia bacterium]HMP00816.1 zf-TFIIB domain-containing protein [Kiritimatiellia bacterium]HMP96067.1 zf-TFIIB domain-containing protein [Kiritimatiellia bacterium]